MGRELDVAYPWIISNLCSKSALDWIKFELIAYLISTYDDYLRLIPTGGQFSYSADPKNSSHDSLKCSHSIPNIYAASDTDWEMRFSQFFLIILTHCVYVTFSGTEEELEKGMKLLGHPINRFIVYINPGDLDYQGKVPLRSRRETECSRKRIYNAARWRWGVTTRLLSHRWAILAGGIADGWRQSDFVASEVNFSRVVCWRWDIRFMI